MSQNKQRELEKLEEDTADQGAFNKLSFIDRYLSIWILLAMVSGVLLGYIFKLEEFLDTIKIDTVSLPIAIGLWLMMWPVLCKVRYELLGQILSEKRMWVQIKVSLILNWIIGPLFMTLLAWIFFPNIQGYRNGLILVGLARCIAMVLIWNQLAQGSPEYCAILVSINSIMQILLYAPLATIYLSVGSEQSFSVGFMEVFKSVMIFLGVPLLFGVLTRYGVILTKGKDWFDTEFVPRISPIALMALIYTILILFAFQGREVVTHMGYVFRVSIPLLIYFGAMWIGSIYTSRFVGSNYEEAVTQAFTAASNNFELAIAVAIGTFGPNSQEALAATVGPLAEVPALLALVYVALWLKKKLVWSTHKELDIGKDTLYVELEDRKN